MDLIEGWTLGPEGRVSGELIFGQLKGIWTSTGTTSAEICTSEQFGTRNWGRIEATHDIGVVVDNNAVKTEPKALASLTELPTENTGVEVQQEFAEAEIVPDTSDSVNNSTTAPALPFFELPAIEGDKYAYHTVPVINFPTADDIVKLIPMPPVADFGSIPPLIAHKAPVGLDFLNVEKADSWPYADLGSKNREEVFAVLEVNNIISPRQLESTVEQFKEKEIVPFRTTYFEVKDDAVDAARQLYTGWAAWGNDEPERIEKLYRFDNGALVELFSFKKRADKLTDARVFDQDNLITTVLSYYKNGEIRVAQTLDSNKHGIKAKYKQDGTATAYAQYKNDELHGLSTKLYDNGSLRFKNNYKDGKQHGVQLGYSRNATLSAYSEWANGKLNGVSYYYDGINLERWHTYRNGKKTGPFCLFDTRNLKLSKTGYFDENEERTSYLWTHENPSDEDKAAGRTFKASVAGYKNGIKDGLFISANGGSAGYQKESNYVKQLLSFRTTDGFIHSVVNYNENGEKDGPAYRMNFDTHLLEALEHYKNGKNNGLWYDYWPICDTGSICHSLSQRAYLPEPEHESFAGLSVIYTWVENERRGRRAEYEAASGKLLSESVE